MTTATIDSNSPSVIVVGPDGVGKTTLVRSLSKMLGIPSFKFPSEKRIFREGGRTSLTFDLGLTHFLRQTGHRFVSDRGYPCEWVYSAVFERETDEDLLTRIDMEHAALDTRILYLYSSVPPFEEDDIVPSEKYSEIRDTYDKFCRWTNCSVARMDTAAMLIDYHRNGRDSSAILARAAIGEMGLGLPHEWTSSDGGWFSCVYCRAGAGMPRHASEFCPRR